MDVQVGDNFHNLVDVFCEKFPAYKFVLDRMNERMKAKAEANALLKFKPSKELLLQKDEKHTRQNAVVYEECMRQIQRHIETFSRLESKIFLAKALKANLPDELTTLILMLFLTEFEEIFALEYGFEKNERKEKIVPGILEDLLIYASVAENRIFDLVNQAIKEFIGIVVYNDDRNQSLFCPVTLRSYLRYEDISDLFVLKEVGVREKDCKNNLDKVLNLYADIHGTDIQFQIDRWQMIKDLIVELGKEDRYPLLKQRVIKDKPIVDIDLVLQVHKVNHLEYAFVDAAPVVFRDNPRIKTLGYVC